MATEKQFNPANFVPVEDYAGDPVSSVFDPSNFVAVDDAEDQVFVEDRGQVISAPESMNAAEVDYMASTDMDKKPKNNFFGMVDFGVGFGKGAVEFFTDANVNWATRNLEKYANQLEKEQPNELTGFIDFMRGKGSQEVAQEVRDEADRLLDKHKVFVERYGLKPEGTAQETGAMFGSGFSSVLASLGTAALTKNILVPAAVFTDIQNASIFREARDKGWTVDKAATVANIDSVPQFVLEFWGLHTAMELIAFSKPIKNKLLRAAAVGAVEATQEGGQQGAEEITAGLSELREDSITDKVIRIGKAAAVGLVTGAGASTVFDVVSKRGIIKDLVKEGVPQEKAEAWAKSVIESQMASPELKNEITQTIRREMSAMAEDPETEKVKTEFMQRLEEQRQAKLTGEQKATDEAAAQKRQAPKLTPEQVLISEGRVERLSEEQSQVLDELDAVEAQQKQLKDKGLSTKKLEVKIKALVQQFDNLDAEMADIMIDLEPEIKLRDKIVTEAGKIVRLAVQKVSEGAKMTREEIAMVQGEAIKFLKATPMEAKDRAKFLSTVKNIQTPEALMNAFPEMEAKIAKFNEESRKKKATLRIQNTLKKTKAKNRGGKPVGKFTAEVQDLLDRAREAAKLDRFQADQKIADNLAQASPEDGSLDAALASENAILDTFSGLDTRSADELEGRLQDLQDLIKEGRQNVFLKMRARQERAAILVNDAIKTMQGNKPVKPTDKPRNGMVDAVEKALKTWGKSISGWDDLMNVFSQDDKSSKSFESALSESMTTVENETAEKARAQEWGQKWTKRALKILGLKKESQLFKKLSQDQKEEDLGVFKDADNREVRLILSRSQARSIWMQMQDQSLKETIFSGEGGYRIGDRDVNGLSVDMQKAITDFLSQEDINLAKANLEFYKEYYPHVNDKYRVDFGVSLPFNENYSPIRRETAKKDITYSFLDEQNFRRSILPGSLKSRVRNREKIKLESDIDVLLRHILEMEHYINWSDKLKDIQTVFGDSRVKNIVRAKFGSDSLKLVNEFVTDFVRNGGEKGRMYDNIVNKVRSNFTVSVLAAKPVFILKQFTSFAGYAEFVPTAEFARGLADFASDPMRAYKILSTSDLVKTRSENINLEIKDALASREFSAFRRSPTFKNAMLVFVKLGDKASILVGGWTVYRYELLKTGDHKKAIAAFEKATTVTQQSSYLSQLSSWQRGNSLQKLFTMFQSAQNQYLRRELAAIRDGLNGRLTKKEVAKKIFIYHFLLPAFFQWVSDFGKWDKEEQTRAMILGPLNGIFILNDILDAMLRKSLNTFADFDLKEFDGALPFMSMKRGVEKAIGDLADSDMDLAAIAEAIAELSATTVGPLTATPIKQILNTYEGLTDVNDGETGRGVLKLAGWAPSRVDTLLDEN